MTQIQVALTGLTGFLGRHAATALLERGVAVRALVRRGRAIPAATTGLEIVEGDLEDRYALGRLCEGAAAVVHCAGAVTALGARDFVRVNGEGTRAVADAAFHAGVRTFVHVSSLAAREPTLSPYAASKAAGETAARHAAGPMSLRIARPPAIYGPGDRATLPLVAALLRPIVVLPGRTKSRLSLLHVRDAAEALATLATDEGVPAGTYEISDGKDGGYGFADLAAAGARITGRPARVVLVPRALLAWPAHVAEAIFRLRRAPGFFTPGKLREIYHHDWVARGPRLEEVSGWRPRLAFEEGLAETVSWYVAHGWLRRPRVGAEKGRNNRGSVLS